MNISLRLMQIDDLPMVSGWYQAIDSMKYYATRYLPKTFNGIDVVRREEYACYMILADGVECGIVWLEKDNPSDNQAFLGILLGSTDSFGRGIGTEAIRQVITNAQTQLSYSSVSLNVRQSNFRGISCYKKCGFEIIDEGSKAISSGEHVKYYIMQRALCDLEKI